MRSESPYALIRKTALALQRRERLTLALVILPPAMALGGLWGIGRLPVEVLAAALIAGGLLALHASTDPVPSPTAASRIDRILEGKDSFLTLATSDPVERRPLQSLVEDQAEALSVDAEPRRFVEPIRRTPIVRSFLYSSLAFLFLAMAPAEQRSFSRPHSPRLAAIARDLEASAAPRDREVARALREVLAALQDRTLSNEEKKAKLRDTLGRLESEAGAAEEASGKTGSSKNASEEQSGREKRRDGQESGDGAGSRSRALQEQAREELEKIAGALAQASDAGESGQESGGHHDDSASREKREAGGGIQGPEKKQGTGERQGGGEGNRPERREAGRESEGNQPDATGQESRASDSSSSRGAGRSGGRDTPSGEGKPADNNSPKAERFYKPGEGPQAWKIENGRYVRVRVPENSPPEGASEIVQKPGVAEPGTAYGNAPLPGPGSPGEARETQPLPLEYGDVLRSPS